MDVPTKTIASPDEVKDFLRPPEQSVDSRVDVRKENVKEIKGLDIDKEIAREHLKRLIEDNKARKTFSYWIFIATVLWMFFVLMIVVQVGRRAIMLSDGVLIALITTTTANVFGFLYVVVNYLFNKEKST
jgi:hypothetical protein